MLTLSGNLFKSSWHRSLWGSLIILYGLLLCSYFWGIIFEKEHSQVACKLSGQLFEIKNIKIEPIFNTFGDFNYYQRLKIVNANDINFIDIKINKILIDYLRSYNGYIKIQYYPISNTLFKTQSLVQWKEIETDDLVVRFERKFGFMWDEYDVFYKEY
ncbi:hypothetical protein N7931_08325 [Catenovulum sp. 2E275]|uniref:hypothetical protein n=1 Tax=Catenovulum sp. 2E275 TaxID=2980497 RepID=UPI0021D1DFF7|nr:hypothetical protein [Catenovulum sp. 2E275]MCU4675636.1 hypothetical protein [Catenovulum sp. 2E275]